MVNGHRAQQQTVQNLFQSVQLNINNPNFLIMQGRITKVLNMKPQEILALIEEAAGTRMFEDRRDKALKTMAKKDKKVEEINDLLRDEIEPKLEKLRTEKRAFLDFQQTQSDLERLTRLVVAHDYVKSQERVGRSAADLEAKKKRQVDIEEGAKRMKSEIANLEEDMQRVKAQRDKELRKGGAFQALEEKVKEMSHESVRLSTVLDLKLSSIAEEQAKHKSSLDNVEEMKKLLKEKTESFNVLKEKHEAAKIDLDASTAEADKKDELLQTLLTGITSREGQESGYQSQLQGTFQ